MQYSPKLKKAMEEIKVILKNYDIAALVVLHTPGHSEYLHALSPSYSCAKFNGDELRIRAKLKEDFNGDKKAWEEKVSNTTNMLRMLAEVGMREAYQISEASEMVDKIVGADHTDLGGSSNTQQNN